MSTMDVPLLRPGMQDQVGLQDRRLLADRLESNGRAGESAVSWGAIVAGAAGAAALAVILLMLGVGLGLSSVSPWTGQGMGAQTMGIATIAWLVFTQLAASGVGGYLAGRLRTKWTMAHTDEVYFRDTAHGFLAWAVGTLMTAALLTTVIGSIVGSGAQAGASLAAGATNTASMAAAGAGAASAGRSGSTTESGPLGYSVDSLFRRSANSSASPAERSSPAGTESANASAAVPTGEVTRIFANSIRNGALPPDDLHYVGQLVAERTGISETDAEKRVTDVYAKAQTTLHDAEVAAQAAADKARKASAYAMLWMFIALLIGAFVASLSATLGGRRRDL
jgi:hypothetical protein